MGHNPYILYMCLGLILMVAAACRFGVSTVAPRTIDMDLINTAAAKTVEVFYTVAAAQTIPVKATERAPTSDVKSVDGSQIVPNQFNTPVPSTTNTPIPSTVTPIPPTPFPCHWVKFVDDLSFPDKTPIHPNLSFTKTWRLQNIGTCAWTADYQVVFSGGEAMSGPVSQTINRIVNPGETVDLSIKFTSPAALGSHTGYWMLRPPEGVVFGWGNNQSKPFWVMINVVALPTINADTPLDIAANYCAATWTNSGGATLPCPAQSEDFINGSIMVNNAPKIEKAYQDNEPALITIPNNVKGGFISGRFPDVVVKSGDHFRALTGCLADSPNCSVGFAVKYSADGGDVQTLSTWLETYDGQWTRPDIDLNFLAGKHVQFILQVSNSNDSSADDRAFWMVPKIGP